MSEDEKRHAILTEAVRMKRRLGQIREERALNTLPGLSKEEYQVVVERLGFIARMTLDIDVPRLLYTIEHAETVAPFLDPTLFLRFLYDNKARANLDAIKEMANCAATLQKIAETLVDAMSVGEKDG